MKRFVLAVACVLLASTAYAQPKSDASALYAQGQERYEAEDYVGAARLFREAHAIDPDPAYLFNIAQSYRLGKQCGDASKYYKRFLQEVPNAPNAEAVRKYIEEVGACARQQAEAKKPPPIMQPDPDPEPEPQPTVTPSTPSARPDTGRRALAFAALGVAGAGVVGGILWNRQVSYWEDQRAEICAGASPTLPCEWNQTNVDRASTVDSNGKRDAILSIASFAVGGVALAGSIYLFVSGGKRSEEQRAMIVPTSNGALVRWSF